MRLTSDGILLSLRAHGEHGGIVRLLTRDDGLQPAYIRGARGRRLRPVLLPGNRVQARLSARTDAQLAQAEVELLHSLAPLYAEPLPAAAIEWSTGLTATVLPDGQAYPRIHDALDGLLGAIEAAPSASGWGAALVRYELLLLAELGFGLDLSRCVAGGDDDDLVAVSPRSGRAVSRAEAAPYAGKLLPLPAFLLRGGVAGWTDILDGMALTGHFLARDLLVERLRPMLDARARLLDRLRRAAGVT